MQIPAADRPRVLDAACSPQAAPPPSRAGSPTRHPGSAGYVAPIPAEVLAAVDGRVRPGPAAAHAAVLAALSGEADVVTGYVPAGRQRPCRARCTAGPATWRELLDRTRAAERELLAHARPSRSEGGAVFEAVLPAARPARRRRAGRGAPPNRRPPGVRSALPPRRARRGGRRPHRGLPPDRVAPHRHRARRRVRPSTACSPPRRSRSSSTGWRARAATLPDRRFHELFEQRVRTHPDAVAAECAGRRWTYRELNARANRIGHALLARGLGREDVVAVATERNLDWMASVLAIFKAGGVYLPVEPHLPADRIAGVLRRAECRVRAHRAGQHDHPRPGAGSRRRRCSGVLIADAYARGAPGRPTSAVPVGPDQLAYIYFTSGSTGEPKGAMCEHAGMLNHLQAKIADLEIGEGADRRPDRPAVLRHLALAAGLGAAGRRPHPDRAAGRDPRRGPLRRHRRRRRVDVLQLVPSYLEVVLTYLEQTPGRLPDLHCVLRHRRGAQEGAGPAVVRDRCPDIKLVNAYGLTETSDDTNHEVMRSAPEGRLGAARACRCRTCASTWSTSSCARSRSAPPARSCSPGSASAAATSTTPSAPPPPTSPTRTGPASGSTWRRLRPLAPGRQAGVPRPPRQPGEDLRVPHRDRRDREHPAAGARRA